MGGAFHTRICGIFFSTSPPLIGIVASFVGLIRRVPIVYWAMDLNPDQLIALGKLHTLSPAARLLEAVNLHILRRSSLVIALDRFMRIRIEQRDPSLNGSGSRLKVIPPWSQEDHLALIGDSLGPQNEARRTFRTAHGLEGKFVVMYSGNHSPSNPLRTLLDAAIRLKNQDGLKFVFVGGGLGKKEVEAAIREQGLTNALSLPYQPLSDLGQSLSSADLHVVCLGDPMVGIVHPCKIYGAMAVVRPVLYFGPRPSHITDLLDETQFGWQVSHGDVDGAVNIIEQARAPWVLSGLAIWAGLHMRRWHVLSLKKPCAANFATTLSKCSAAGRVAHASHEASLYSERHYAFNTVLRDYAFFPRRRLPKARHRSGQPGERADCPRRASELSLAAAK